MSYSEPSRAAARRTRARVVAAVVAASTVVLLHDGWTASSATERLLHDSVGLHDARAALGEADGVVPDGVTVFDDVPAVTRLDPALRGALRRAGTDATNDGVRLYVDSGWRSARYQEALFRQAVAKYGSAKEASRWVATPATSAHVSGDAVDLGPADARTWLSEHGAGYGLCQVYANEPWHYELRPAAVDHGCPQPYADAAHDPRMR